MAEKAPKGALQAFLDWIAAQIEEFLFPKKPHHPTLSWWLIRLSKKGISRGALLTIVFFAIQIASSELLPNYYNLVGGWLLLALPLLLTVGLGMTFWAFWIWYVQTYFIFTSTNPVLLEVRMPTEVTKSPRAMEQVLTTMWMSSGETTEFDRYWKGGVRPYFSLEIASFGGQLHFYIWCRKNAQNIIEAAMYAQYPEVEIVEAEDYSQRFVYDPKVSWMYWNEYKLSQPDVFPIKTYVDFELDKDPKEEFKVEPFAQVLETLGSLNQNEQGWLQIVCRQESPKDWIAEVRKAVDEIRKNMSLGENDDAKGFPRPSWSQQEQMRNMERNMGKLLFTVGVRSAYIAIPPTAVRGVELSAIRMIFRPFFNPAYLNELRPDWGHNIFDYGWQDYKDFRRRIITRRYLDAYRRRQFWHPPWKRPFMRMTTEVIATLWHPPSRTIQTPGLQRIPTAKAEPPPNLPL